MPGRNLRNTISRHFKTVTGKSKLKNKLFEKQLSSRALSIKELALIGITEPNDFLKDKAQLPYSVECTYVNSKVRQTPSKSGRKKERKLQTMAHEVLNKVPSFSKFPM
jgi:hypothetical protein